MHPSQLTQLEQSRLKLRNKLIGIRARLLNMLLLFKCEYEHTGWIAEAKELVGEIDEVLEASRETSS